MRTPEEKRHLLNRLADDYRDCARCTLAHPAGRARRTIVFGEGNPGARIMIVCEAPGYYDDIKGRPMLDDPGQEILDPLLRGLNSSREEVFITTLVMCRPSVDRRPDLDRPPTKDEVAACSSRLYRQIDIVDPYVIICMGNTAFKLLTTEKKTILQVARDQTLPMLWAETPGTFLPVQRTAYVTFDAGWLLKLYREQGEDRFFRVGSDMHHTHMTFRRAFAVADQHAFMNLGIPHPPRGDDS
jgi:uracil-DNA glycosylase family 4